MSFVGNLLRGFNSPFQRAFMVGFPQPPLNPSISNMDRRMGRFGLPGVPEPNDGLDFPMEDYLDINPKPKLETPFIDKRRYGSPNMTGGVGKMPNMALPDQYFVSPFKDERPNEVPAPNPFFNGDPDYFPNANPVALKYGNQAATRNQRVKPYLEQQLDTTAQEVYGAGSTVEIYSGGQPAKGAGRVGTHRHDEGGAADVRVYRPDGSQVKGDELVALHDAWRKKGIGGVGLGMQGGNALHLDMHADPSKLGPKAGLSWTYGGATEGQRKASAATSDRPSQMARPGFNIRAAMQAISDTESGGRYDIWHDPTETGARAVGKYGIMDYNIPKWTKQVLGREMTPDEFRLSPQAQDAVFTSIFGDLLAKYGPEGAARAWYTGSAEPNERKDIHGKYTGNSYGRQFAQMYAKYAGMPDFAGGNIVSMPSMAGIGGGVGKAATEKGVNERVARIYKAPESKIDVVAQDIQRGGSVEPLRTMSYQEKLEVIRAFMKLAGIEESPV